MRIHANTLDMSTVYAAASAAGVSLTRFTRHGSRKRDHAFDVTLSGSSGRRQNFGDDEAATWDEWGIFLAALFAADESVTIPNVYTDAADYHWQTADRFRTLTREQQCRAHKWHGALVGDGVSRRTCRKCGAVNRFRWAR